VLRITDDALAALSEMLSKGDAAADVAIRFVLDGEELAMKTDNESPGDTAFQHEDRTVLLVDGRLAEVLADSTLDFTDEGFELSSDEES